MPFLSLILPLVAKYWKAVAIGLAVLLGALFLIHERAVLIQKGATEATVQIDKANHEEMRRANEAQDTVDGCFAVGRDWDRTRGVCF